MGEIKLRGQKATVTGYIQHREFGTVPVVDLRMMTDLEWARRCLKSRQEYPELYRKPPMCEDVEAVIAGLRRSIAKWQRISNGLNLSQESRERIRSELVSYQKKQGNFESISTEKSTFKSRVPFIVAAIVTAMVLTLTAAAAVAHLFKNNIIVPSSEDIPISSSKNTNVPANGDGAIVSPAGNAPATLEKIIQSKRAKSDDWFTGDMISAGVMPEYYQWDFVEVLSNDPVLRSRRIGRKDGAEKIEYTAENPVNLIDTLTGHVTFDLKWLNENYNYVPDANLS